MAQFFHDVWLGKVKIWGKHNLSFHCQSRREQFHNPNPGPIFSFLAAGWFFVTLVFIFHFRRDPFTLGFHLEIHLAIYFDKAKKEGTTTNERMRTHDESWRVSFQLENHAELSWFGVPKVLTGFPEIILYTENFLGRNPRYFDHPNRTMTFYISLAPASCRLIWATAVIKLFINRFSWSTTSVFRTRAIISSQFHSAISKRADP